jgi:hypothetical protein
VACCCAIGLIGAPAAQAAAPRPATFAVTVTGSQEIEMEEAYHLGGQSCFARRYNRSNATETVTFATRRAGRVQFRRNRRGGPVFLNAVTVRGTPSFAPGIPTFGSTLRRFQEFIHQEPGPCGGETRDTLNEPGDCGRLRRSWHLTLGYDGRRGRIGVDLAENTALPQIEYRECQISPPREVDEDDLTRIEGRLSPVAIFDRRRRVITVTARDDWVGEINRHTRADATARWRLRLTRVG